jgi:protein disulfide-isomerase A1
LESSIEGGKKMKETRYRGPRTVAGMKSFVKKREIPDLSKLAREDMDFRRVDDIVFIAFLDPSDTSHLATFSSIAQEHHLDFAFGYTTDISLAAKEKIQAPSVICYRNLNGDNIILSGAFTFADVEKFLLAAQKSVVKDFREKDIDVFMQRDKLTVYIFTTSTDHKSIRHELTLLAKGFERHVTVAIVDLARYPEMPANFGTEVQGEQALVVHAPLDDQIFRYKQTKKIESAVVEDMLMTILQGKAVNGQVFGEDAADVSAGGDADTNEEDGHDEL